MCIIIKQPEGETFPIEKVFNAYSHNKDGFGIMYWEDDQVRVKRSGPCKFSKIENTLSNFEGKEIGIHLRFGTSGEAARHNSHPYKILTKDKDGTDLYVMHNGVLNFANSRIKTKSDTWHFVEDWLRPMANKYGADLFFDPRFKDLLGSKIGSSNRLLFLDSNHRWSGINGTKATFQDSFWVSNNSYFTTSWDPTWDRYKKEGDAAFYSPSSWKDRYKGKSQTGYTGSSAEDWNYPLVQQGGTLDGYVQTKNGTYIPAGYYREPYGLGTDEDNIEYAESDDESQFKLREVALLTSDFKKMYTWIVQEPLEVAKFIEWKLKMKESNVDNESES